MRTKKHHKKARATHRRRAIIRRGEKFTSEDVWVRDNYICQICGLPLAMSERHDRHPLAPTVDHIIPLSRGGTHTMSNVQSAHAFCNTSKASYTTSYAHVSALFRWFPIEIPYDIAPVVMGGFTF